MDMDYLKSIKEKLQKMKADEKPYILVVEGIDGSGKETQTRRLQEQLQTMGVKTKLISYPRYDNPSSGPIRTTLSGELGDINSVNPYAFAAMYAVDRYISYKEEIENTDADIVILDRWVSANLLHQASKVHSSEQYAFMLWVMDFEYVKCKLPTPNLTLFLTLPVDTAVNLVEKRNKGNQKDIHERDTSYLKKSAEMGKIVGDLHNQRSLRWREVECVKDGVLKSVDEINNEILKHLEKYL